MSRPTIFTIAALMACIVPRGATGFGVWHRPAMQSLCRPTSQPTGLFMSTAVEVSQITMPALSSTMKEGRVVSWLKSEGDEIEAGEAIMVVESDKADMDVEAFEDGVLAKILVAEGEMAPVGAPVAILAPSAGEIQAVLSSWEGSSGGSSGSSATAASVDVTPAAAVGGPPDVEFSQIDMPALSSTMKEGKVVSWLKAEGDPISAGEAIMVVESDKADMDVEAFEDGILAAIITGEGESSVVGAPVALIAQNEVDIPTLQAYAATLSGKAPVAAAPAPTLPAPATPKVAAAAAAATVTAVSTGVSGDRVVASPLARKRAEELGVDLSTVMGSGPKGRVTATDVEAAASGAGAAAPAKAAAPAADKKPLWTPAPGVIAATPTARALAKKTKLDISKIKGTGEFGRVTADDVRIASGEKKVERAKPISAAASTIEMLDGFTPFTGMQRAVSNNMVATLATPEFRVSRDIVMDNFDALYQHRLKAKGVSVSAMLAKATALAIEKYPILNSSFKEGGILYKKDINIAMAVAIEGGLITPTLMYANERSIIDLAENWKELVDKAKNGKLSPAEYQSGTFTISNMGMFGVTHFGALLPAGQGGILAIGGTREVIVPDRQAVLGMKVAKVMTVTLTCDHRQIYGVDAALFLKELANIMENQFDRIAA